MDPKTPQRRTIHSDGDITRMCAINTQGVVFLNRRPLELSTELTLTVQTSVLGTTHDWSVRGLVVACQPELTDEREDYRVTLFFSEVPPALRNILALAEGDGIHAYPVVPGAEQFGLN